MKRLGVFVFGVLAYAVFFATFLYAIGFVGDLVVPKSIDAEPTVPPAQAIVVDTLLLGLFAAQHSIMARPAFKRILTRLLPEAAERSTYVLASSLALVALFAFWQPIGGVVWDVQNPIGRAVLHGLFAFGWGLVLVAIRLEERDLMAEHGQSYADHRRRVPMLIPRLSRRQADIGQADSK